MENRDFYEILSPVGDMETFYTAIKSGANAVYMGLPKFNARMRAENINLDNLSKLVSFAHLKNVQVYITLNTILKDSEIKEAIELVGICLSSGVDAFIVQDFGLVYALKSVYPDIVLHGSTQMGVHNVRGAKVAKELGLSRVVLSREVTLSDIEDIANNVDIELEVFIQGAMCVCFSGNCYISSIKHNASGNRGECKQLCRLPYTLTDGKNTKKGYMISPRDNSMIDYLDKLMELGVKSYKIEGRLRHSGYVRVCTSTYASAMNDILEHKEINKEKLKKNLSRVFARGEYISGYFNGNDIINKDTNNHLGEYIGEVVSSSKFKDIFKITLKLNRNIVQNDGLKFVLSNNDIITLGVGNIEYNGNNIIVYGKNYIPAKSKVYLSLDSKFESSYIDIDTKIKLKMAFEGYIGNRCSLRITYNDIDITEYGEVCQSPKSKPITSDNVINQLSKIDKSVFDIENIDIDMEEVFLPLSAINELRRNAVDKIIEKLTYIKPYTKCDMPKINTTSCNYSKLVIVDERCNINTLKSYDAVILSPTEYSKEVISGFKKKLIKINKPLIINLPIIALRNDLKVIDDIVKSFKDDIFIANNIYALSYIKDGVKVIAGYGLNVANEYSKSMLISYGVSEVISSIEKWCPTLSNTYKVTKGKLVLMTMAHCPNKTLNSNTCSTCKFSGELKLSGNIDYTIRRYKIAQCYFELVDERAYDLDGNYTIEDLRG